MTLMHHPRWRSPVVALILVLLVSGPVTAVDPPDAPSPGVERTSSPTIHAEMAAGMADARMAFAPGARPVALEGTLAPTSVAGESGLPNGLAREVFGYLPYWALTDELLPSLDYDRVSTIAYFGLAARADGTLEQSGTHWAGWTSTHMTSVINAAHAEGVSVVLTVTMMAWDGNYTSMSSLLNSPTKRNQLAATIASTVAARNADGVNLDFEPVPDSLEDAYTAFVRAVKAAIGARYLTVATTAGAATWNEGYDLAGLTAAGAADALMVMGYDLNWSGSSRAGGVAPVVSPYALDIDTAMADYLARVPASRLIWGVPYYGRAWTTTGTAVNGQTCRSAGGCTAASWTFRYADAIGASATHGRRWDATGSVPWYTYRSATYDAQVQAYYDDAQSLDIKYDLATDEALRGVGIWHLLMDAGRPELWNEIAQNLLALPFNDIDDSVHWQAIVWLAEHGISGGCGGGRFCPTKDVSRGEMASFLSRALDLPDATRDWFVDDAASVHEPDIDRIAEAAITSGCAAQRYCPDRAVRRDEMATFLARALHLPPPTVDVFADDTGNPHEDAINRLAAAGIAAGCRTGAYCPAGLVTREQMASFLRRALGP